MNIIVISIVIFIISFLWALFSMKDMRFADELYVLLKKKRSMRGTILFFKNKIIHFHSSNSSFSSSK